MAKLDGQKVKSFSRRWPLPNTHWCRAFLVRSPCSPLCQFRSSSASSSLTFREELHHLLKKKKISPNTQRPGFAARDLTALVSAVLCPGAENSHFDAFSLNNIWRGMFSCSIVQLFMVISDLYLMMTPWSGQPCQPGKPTTISSPIPKKPGSDLQPVVWTHHSTQNQNTSIKNTSRSSRFLRSSSTRFQALVSSSPVPFFKIRI